MFIFTENILIFKEHILYIISNRFCNSRYDVSKRGNTTEEFELQIKRIFINGTFGQTGTDRGRGTQVSMHIYQVMHNTFGLRQAVVSPPCRRVLSCRIWLGVAASVTGGNVGRASPAPPATATDWAGIAVSWSLAGSVTCSLTGGWSAEGWGGGWTIGRGTDEWTHVR